MRKASGFNFKGMPVLGPNGLASRWGGPSWEHPTPGTHGALGWHPPGWRGGCPLPWPLAPWGQPPMHQQEQASSLNSSYPRAQPRVMQMHTRVHQTVHTMGPMVLCAPEPP